MRSQSVSWVIRRAVLVAMAPACGDAAQPPLDAGVDASTADATVSDATADAVDTDADVIDDTFVPPDIGPPPGCTLFGKPDHFAPCGYTEQIFDSSTCLVDTTADGGVQEANLCNQLCSWDEPDCVYYSLGDAGEYVTCGAGCVGRLHEGARRDLAERCEPIAETDGEVLARAAILEASSVDAFRALADELRERGAPTALIRDAERSARDEVRHARSMAALASAYGREARRPSPATRRVRPLVDLAIENAVEGCVRETYGAALAHWQAAQAHDPRVRAVMRGIARDESRHAELGWRIHRWACSKLSAVDRRRVTRARLAAARDLARSIDATRPRSAIGVPDVHAARAMYRSLSTLWNQPSA
jgi:hypothetical protein